MVSDEWNKGTHATNENKQSMITKQTEHNGDTLTCIQGARQ